MKLLNYLSIFFFISFISKPVFAQDSVSVLFLGNSYTYVNDLPNLIKSIANSFGDELYFDQNTPGGYTLEGHAGNATTQSKIKLNPWDYVIIQAQSQEPSFPDAQVNSNTLPYAVQLADSVYSNNFCSEVMFYMTWGREDGDPQWGPISTFEGMNDRLRSAYLRFADSVDGSVSPVGSAWRYVRENHPTIQLYAGDGSHPSYEGSYLAACTFYASLFRSSPVGSSFIGSLPQATADILQNAAALTVLPADSLELFNIRSLSEHTQAEFSFTQNGGQVDFNNESMKAQSYEWNFGDGTFSSVENPSHSFGSGTFDIELIAISECDSDTITYSITVDINTIIDLEIDDLIELNSSALRVINDQVTGLDIYDEMGRLLLSTKLDEVNLSVLSSGVYLVQVHTADGFRMIKLYID